MANLFGWLNHPSSETSVRCLLDSYPPSCCRIENDAAGMLKTEGEIWTVENCWITFSGRPYWKSKKFDEISKAQGFGRAVFCAYRQHDKDFLSMLGGQFALAVLIPTQNQALLAIDRMGIEDLAYNDRGGLFFSNSLSDLKKMAGPEAEISTQAIYDYMYFHMVPSPQTIYQGVRKLGPAQYLSYKNGCLEIGEYWHPVFNDEQISSTDELAAELRETLFRSVSRQLDKGHTGAFLSGGLDSSSVAGCLAKLSKTPVNTYTIAFDAEGYDESEFAQIASDHFGTRQITYSLSPEDVLDAIPRIAAAYEEPFGNSSAIPTYFCAKRAREDGIDTLLAGDGGDELFAGNERYAKQMRFEPYSVLPNPLRWALRGICDHLPNADSIPLLRKARNYILLSSTPLPDRLERYNFLHRHDIKEIFDPQFLDSVDPDEPLDHLRNYFNKNDSASNLNRMLFLDWKITLADNDLRKVNEMCKLAGVRVAYPMLDDELVELSCKIPGKLKLKRGQLRYFYKFAFKDFLPEKILNKSKHGFGLPFGVWIQNDRELQDFAYSRVNKLRSRGFFKSSFLDESIRLHRDEHAAYYGELIWILMMLEVWLAHHCDSSRD